MEDILKYMGVAISTLTFFKLVVVPVVNKLQSVESNSKHVASLPDIEKRVDRLEKEVDIIKEELQTSKSLLEKIDTKLDMIIEGTIYPQLNHTEILKKAYEEELLKKI